MSSDEKLSIENSLRAISCFSLSAFKSLSLLGTDSLEEKRKKMSKVTKREIVKVAKKVKIDTVFLLEGGK